MARFRHIANLQVSGSISQRQKTQCAHEKIEKTSTKFKHTSSSFSPQHKRHPSKGLMANCHGYTQQTAINWTSNKMLIKWKHLIYIAPLKKSYRKLRNTQCVFHKQLISDFSHFLFLLRPPHKQIKGKDTKLLENVYWIRAHAKHWLAGEICQQDKKLKVLSFQENIQWCSL